MQPYFSEKTTSRKRAPFLASLLALLAVLLLTQPGQAQIVSGTLDILVGFHDGTGAQTNDYYVDLGDVANLVSGQPISVNIAGDLTAMFGNSWQTNTSLKWSVTATTYDGTAGTSSVPAGTLFNTVGAGTPKAASWTNLNTSAVNFLLGVPADTAGTATNYQYMGAGNTITYLNDASGQATTDFGFTYPAAALYSYSAKVGTYTNTSKLGVSSVQNAVTAAATTTGVKMEEWTSDPNNPGTVGAVTQIGTWTLDTNPDDGDQFGVLTFTPTAAPEPSTYGLMAAAAGFFFLVLRLRARKA